MTKITFVGAGSVVFTKKLICDLLQYPALADARICLMDIDPQRLEVTRLLAQRIVRQLKVPARVEATTNLRKACRGARFVFSTIQVGGYRPCTVTDFEIPKKYGLRQTIADTLGVGGIFRALRTIPELLKIAREIADHGAPDPLFLNYSNPMAMNMWAVDRGVGVPAVGLCHSVQGTSRQLASYLGLEYSEFSFLCAGINHMAFFLELRHRGRDVYPLLFNLLDQPGFKADKVRFEMMRRLGYFVTESSEHHSEYVPYFIHHGEEMVERFDIPLDEYLRRCESIIATWKKTEKEMLTDQRAVRISRSVEYGAEIVHAMVTGGPTVVYGNVPNRGSAISNLPAACCVEVPCLVDHQGVQATVVGALPPQLAALIRTNVNVQELTVEAALSGRREHIYHAAMMDPHTSATLPLDRIWALCDELIEAHQRDGFLGEFSPVRPGTGRSRASLERVLAEADFTAEADYSQASLPAVLRISNQTTETFAGTIEALVEGGRTTLPPKVRVEVEAGRSMTLDFVLERAEGTSEGARLRFECAHPRWFARDLILAEREVIRADAAGFPLEVNFAEETVAAGRVSVSAAGLRVAVRVRDTDIRFDEKEFWDGSVVELFFGDAAGSRRPRSQIVVLPSSPEPKVMTGGRDPLPGVRCSCRPDAGGYDLDLSLPWETIGVSSGKAFLFECIVGVNALGDAHGKTRVVWQRSVSPHLDSRRFALVLPHGPDPVRS